MMEQENGYIILDVRTPAEFAEKHIPNAINIPNETIGTDEISALPDKDQLIMVYCRSGRRSKEAAEKAGIDFLWAAYGFGKVTSYTEKLDSPMDLIKRNKEGRL